ncbi:hypothetical protein DN39_2121 [Vibrio cholerae]|nr:hypothetical protein DN39_2121 [Vibrio cholerae]
MRLGELTYLTDQIVTFGFSSLELRNKACPRWHYFNGNAKCINW